jgi:dipeptidyl aminopeptidase/acylaminoacyl peptidase
MKRHLFSKINIIPFFLVLANSACQSVATTLLPPAESNTLLMTTKTVTQNITSSPSAKSPTLLPTFNMLLLDFFNDSEFANRNTILFEIGDGSAASIDLAYISDRGGKINCITCGSNLTKENTVTYPAWSPDGNMYAIILSSNNHTILLHGIENINIELISGELHMFENPAWSPDGNKIAFGFSNIDDDEYPVCIMGTTTSSTSEKEKRCISAGKFNDYPYWSKDGKKIILSAGGSLYCCGREQRDLFIWDVDTQNVIQFTNTPETEISPKWSPDGSRLAFLVRNAGEDNFTLTLANADGSGRFPIAGTGNVDSFDWSPDGKRIVYAEFSPIENVECDFGCYSFRVLKIVDLETGEIRTLTDGTQYVNNPSWRPAP